MSLINDLERIGSETARSGFANEESVVERFNSWRNDYEAREWLEFMGYNLEDITNVEAETLPNSYKTDIHVRTIIGEEVFAENISAKRTKISVNYNQIDQRWVRDYQELWNIPEDITELLEMFSGEMSPYEHEISILDLRDSRRFFLDELDYDEVQKMINFFEENKEMVVNDIIKGREDYAADWMLVTKYDDCSSYETSILADIDYAMNVFGGGEVGISPRGSLNIGRITMTRKGGDAGRETANKLQFNISPCDLFDYSEEFPNDFLRDHSSNQLPLF